MVKDFNAIGFKRMNDFQVVVDDAATPAHRAVVEAATNEFRVFQNTLDGLQLRVFVGEGCWNPPASSPPFANTSDAVMTLPESSSPA